VIQSCIDILEVVGTVVATDDEAEMVPLVVLTGSISSLYELMKTSEEFMLKQVSMMIFRDL